MARACSAATEHPARWRPAACRPTRAGAQRGAARALTMRARATLDTPLSSTRVRSAVFEDRAALQQMIYEVRGGAAA